MTADALQRYDLRLMSWGDGSEVPTSGNNFVIVGADNQGLLHIRIFDAGGNRVTDTDETKLPPIRASAISTLKQQLPGLLPPHVLASAEKVQVVSEVTSIVGPPRVFLSYSKDSDNHAGRVLELADSLCTYGIDVILDRYHPAPEQAWPRWMEQNLDEAEFVLMVCTETYCRRAMGLEKPGKGHGVTWEGNLIYNAIYHRIEHDQPSGSRFIPILLPGSEPSHIPSPVQGHTYYQLSAFNLNDPNYEALYRHLTGQPATPQPDLGQIQILPPTPRPQVSQGLLPPRPRPDPSDNPLEKDVQEEGRRWPPPSRRPYAEIIGDLREGMVVPVLGPGVNPRIYIDLASRLVSLLVKKDVQDEPNVAEGKEKIFLEKRERSEFDLQLQFSLNDVSDIRKEGRDLIIVAAVNNVLHFRIFDGVGEVVVDTDENRLAEEARQIKDLRKQLESLWPPHQLTRDDEGRVASAVTSIVGHTLERKILKDYYGSPCTICHFLPSVPPGCPLLAGDSKKEVYDEQELSVAKMNCRNLSRLYETRANTEKLYNKLADCISEHPEGDNAIYLVLARLLKDRQSNCDRRKDPSRDRKPLPLPFPFIITSNFDAGLERVFEGAGIRYDLVWLVAAQKSEESNEVEVKRGKWLYLGYGAEGRVILPSPGPETSQKCPAFSLRKGADARVIIIKIFGSINDSSCERVSNNMLEEDDYFLITQDQMEAFFGDQVDDLPQVIVNKIRDMKLLFLGFSPNDPDLRAIVDRLYGKEKMRHEAWLIHRCEPGKLDREVWRYRGVELVRVTDSLEQTMLALERGVRDGS